MEVVEFDVGRVAGLQHLHLDEGGDRLDVVWRQPVEEAEHERAPCPEAVARVRAATFGEARHGALEGVAVGVRRGGEEDADPVVRACGAARFDGGDAACGVDGHADAFGPPLIGQRLSPPRVSAWSSLLDALICADIYKSSADITRSVMLLANATLAGTDAHRPYGLIEGGALALDGEQDCVDRRGGGPARRLRQA